MRMEWQNINNNCDQTITHCEYPEYGCHQTMKRTRISGLSTLLHEKNVE